MLCGHLATLGQSRLTCCKVQMNYGVFTQMTASSPDLGPLDCEYMGVVMSMLGGRGYTIVTGARHVDTREHRERHDS